MPAKFILYYDSSKQIFIDYIKNSSAQLRYLRRFYPSNIQYEKFSKGKKVAELPSSLRKLLFFAHPDAVLCINDGIRPIRPIFAFELTEHVPAQDHWMQRFNNLVGCAQEGVPGAYIMPFSMPKHPKYPGTLDYVFFYAYNRVAEIHRTPFIIAEWPVENDGYTKKVDFQFTTLPPRKTRDIKQTFAFLDMVIDAATHGRPLTELTKTRLIVDLQDYLRARAYETHIQNGVYVKQPQIKNFGRLSFHMKNNRMLDNSELEGWLKTIDKKFSILANMPDHLAKRNRNLIFVPQCERAGKTESQLRAALLVRIKEKGGDPYLGQPLAFDYIFCRLGETPFERDTNLIIDLSVLLFSDFASYIHQAWRDSSIQYTNPKKIKHFPSYTLALNEGLSYSLKNVVRVYGFVADVLVFKDVVVVM